MADNQLSYDSLGKAFFEEWDSKLDKEILDTSIPTSKSFNESSLVLDNGTLYGSSRGLSRRRVISSLEDSEVPQKDDHRDLINHINDMLKKNGFGPLKSSSHGSMLRLIRALLENIEELTYGMNFASLENIFKKFFNRSIDKNNKFDLAIVSMITVYEMQKNNFQREIEKLVKELQGKMKKVVQIEGDLRQGYQVLNEMQEKLNVLENRGTDAKTEVKDFKGGNAENQEIIDEVCKILSIKQPLQIPAAVAKLEKVLRAVPQLEKFIKEVYQIVASEEKAGKISMELVIPALRQSFRELKELRTRRKTPEKRMQTTFEQEVIEHFKHLFEIVKDEDIIETMDQVFLFVHELRSFLKSIRSALNLDEDVTVNGILLRLKRMIENF